MDRYNYGPIRGRGAQDVHLVDFHCTSLELCSVEFKFSVDLRPQRPCGLLGTIRAQDGHLHFHYTAPELCDALWSSIQLELRSCVKVEVAVLLSSSFVYLLFSVPLSLSLSLLSLSLSLLLFFLNNCFSMFHLFSSLARTSC